MAVKYYSDGTYTKGDGKLYRPGIGVVGNDKSTNVSKAESTSSPSATTNTNKSSSNKTTITTMRGTGSGSSNANTLKENITNSINNPSNGAYSSLSNNSLMKDMVTAYNQSTGSNAKAPTVTSNPVVEEVVEEEELYNPYEDQMEYYKKAYEDLEAQIREQNRLAVEQGTNRLNAQKSNINQSADENARQAYVQYMQSQKALPQQLASQGVSGGATETANLGLQTAYQNNVNAINQNKANRLQEIDNAIVDLQNTGDLSTVEQVLANNQAALDAYTANLDKGVSYNQWAQQFNANREDTTAEQAYRDKVYADQLAQQDRENELKQMQAYWDVINEQNKLLSDEKKEERDNILQLYTGGYMSRDEAAARLGYDPEILYDTMNYLTRENELALKDKQMDINNTQSLINDRNVGGGGSGSSKYNSVYKEAEKLWNDQNVSAENLNSWLAQQNITEAEHDKILTTLGAKAVLDNLDRLGKLSY